MGIDEYRLGKTPFLLSVRREGVSLWLRQMQQICL